MRKVLTTLLSILPRHLSAEPSPKSLRQTTISLEATGSGSHLAVDMTTGTRIKLHPLEIALLRGLWGAEIALYKAALTDAFITLASEAKRFQLMGCCLLTSSCMQTSPCSVLCSSLLCSSRGSFYKMWSLVHSSERNDREGMAFFSFSHNPTTFFKLFSTPQRATTLMLLFTSNSIVSLYRYSLCTQ